MAGIKATGINTLSNSLQRQWVRLLRQWIALIILVAIAANQRPARSAPGDLDTGFDGDGIVVTNLTGHGYGSDSASDVAVQTDGKIIAVGNANSSIALVRYTSSGRLDSSFGRGGIVFTSFSARDTANAVALQSDGKIVVAGQTDYEFFLVARYNSNGSLDRTFGSGGKVATRVIRPNENVSPYFPSAEAIALQSDGKIVVAGTGGKNFTVVRYNRNGSIDGRFGQGGIARTYIGDERDYAQDVVLQGDGKILVAGGSGDKVAIVRYNRNGIIDSSFGRRGIVVPQGNTYGYADAIALQNDGKILVAGSSLARYLSNGSLDRTFGSNGTVNRNDLDVADMVVQGDGKITLATRFYSTSTNDHPDFRVIRYDSNGNLDSSFGNNGIVVTDLGGGVGNVSETGDDDFPTSIALQTDGKIVVAGIGHGHLYNSAGHFAVVRYMGSATTDTVPPEVFFSSHTNRAFVNRLSFFSGAVRDPQTAVRPASGVARVELSIQRRSDNRYWSGTAWVASEARLATELRSGGWIRNSGLPTFRDLSEGSYILQARATDHADNQSTVKLTVTVDRSGPHIYFTYPTSNTLAPDLSRITGRAEDNSGITKRVDLVLYRHADRKYWSGIGWVPAPVRLDTVVNGSSWARLVQLPTGDNLRYGVYTLWATAYDALGNRGSASITVTVFSMATDRLMVGTSDAINEPAKNSSADALSTASASAAHDTVSLSFMRPLNPDAVSGDNYSVLVNGAPAVIESIIVRGTVAILVLRADIESNDQVEVRWRSIPGSGTTVVRAR